MSTTTYLAPYWGELKAITSIDQVLCFVSEHKEKYKTALFSIDLESRQASEVSLPAGGVALENNTTHIWIAGSDCCLYVYDIKKKSLSKLGQPFNAPATNLVLASNGRLLVTVDTELLILDSLSAKPLQVLGLPAMATALAVDPGGHWAAVGDQ